MTIEFKTLREYFEKYGEAGGLARALTDCSGNYTPEADILWDEINKYLDL